MPIIKFLAHKELCPEGKDVEANPGESILDVALAHGIHLEHACDKSCACTTCHVLVRQGFNTMEPATEREEDLLDRAWGLESCSRLGCQAIVGDADITVDIPMYSLNHAKEG